MRRGPYTLEQYLLAFESNAVYGVTKTGLQSRREGLFYTTHPLSMVHVMWPDLRFDPKHPQVQDAQRRAKQLQYVAHKQRNARAKALNLLPRDFIVVYSCDTTHGMITSLQRRGYNGVLVDESQYKPGELKEDSPATLKSHDWLVLLGFQYNASRFLNACVGEERIEITSNSLSSLQTSSRFSLPDVTSTVTFGKDVDAQHLDSLLQSYYIKPLMEITQFTDPERYESVRQDFLNFAVGTPFFDPVKEIVRLIEADMSDAEFRRIFHRRMAALVLRAKKLALAYEQRIKDG